MELVVRNLSKTYPNGVRALDGIALTVGAGMFGLLGPNGAGKSSLMRTIATLQHPDRGSITFGDLDVLAEPDGLRRMLGYLPQEFGFYPSLSAEHTLDHFAMMKGVIDRTDRRALVADLLRQTNLYAVRKKAVGSFSGGMKQRLGIAMALAGSTEAPDRRRADRGPRPDRAASVPQPAGRDRTGDRGDPVHPHRRRRPRALPDARDHQPGAGHPPGRPARDRRHDAREALAANGGEARSPGASSQPSGHLDPAPRRRARGARLQRNAARAGFEPLEPDLEDVYFFHLAPADRELAA